MLKNYLKIAFRNLFHNQVSSFINIGGLAIGMSVAVLIGLWIWDEVSYNTYHDHYEQIAQVKRKGKSRGETFVSDYQVSALGNHLLNAYGNHFERMAMVRRTEEHILSFEDKNFTQTGNFMQAEAPELFSLKMLSGTRSGLTDIHSILLSESMAKKFFAGEEAIGKIIKINNAEALTVTGVYKDLPRNSTFHEATFLAPLPLFFTMNELDPNAWSNQNMLIYAQLREGSKIEEVNALIKDEYAIQADRMSAAFPPQLFLHPMRKWHLYSEFENGKAIASSKLKFLWFNGIIGIFVLLLACINFMNLSTARSEKRIKEVGIRKTIGSMRSQLIQQFLSESLLVTVLAFSGALVFVQFSLPWFNRIADKDLSILWSNPAFWLAGLFFTFITGLLAGSYPAFYLSAFRPVKALKGQFGSGRMAALPRKTLVVFQFTISIALIIGTFVVHRQIQHAKDRPVGYSGSGLLMVPKRVPEFYGKFDLLKTELKKTGVVSEVAQANYPLTNTLGNNSGFDWAGKDPGFNPTFNTIRISKDYGRTVEWEVLAGRDFSEEFQTDRTGVIINESAAELMAFDDPIGQALNFERDYFGSNNFTILGVTQDMIKDSPFEPAFPSIMFLGQRELYWLLIRINPQYTAREALPQIEQAIKTLIPSAPFDYKFVDEEYAAKFEAEERLGKLATIFAVLAVLISCLGLFGLAVYLSEKRTKEIGVRKILGASVGNIIGLLSKDFIKLVLISNAIAIPLTWYIAGQWLNGFSYRVGLQWWIFAGTGLLAVLIAFLTVGLQSAKAAFSNPVDSLRVE